MDDIRRWMLLCEAPGWSNGGWYHGTSDQLDDGASPTGRMVYLTADREDAAFYGRRVYECSVFLGKIADLWNSKSTAFQAVVASFTRDHPNVIKFLNSGKMWEIDKQLERKVRNFLMIDKGFDTIVFRDNSPNDDSEVGSIVTWARNVKVVQQIR